MVMENTDGILSEMEKKRLRSIFRELKRRSLIHSDLRFTCNKPSLIRTSWSGNRIYYDGAFVPPGNDDQLRLVLLHEGGHGIQVQFAKICLGFVITTLVALFGAVVLGGAKIRNDLASTFLASVPTPVLISTTIVGAICVGVLLGWFQFFFFRIDEYRADKYAGGSLQIEFDDQRPSEVLEALFKYQGEIEKRRGTAMLDWKRSIFRSLRGCAHPSNEDRIRHLRDKVDDSY